MFARRKAFTIVELIIVICIILILLTISIPVFRQIWDRADNVKCINNLRVLGTLFVGESVKVGGYPMGGASPGEWDVAFNWAMTHMGNQREIGDCPSSKPTSQISPRSWSTNSYAYVGNLNPVYDCNCEAWCTESPTQIWTLYWSGVEFKGAAATAPTAHLRNIVSNFKNLPLATNLKFQSNRVDSGESTKPTVPDHLDNYAFHSGDIVKYDSMRALRQIPNNIQDHVAQLPLLMDILVFVAAESELPASTATTWTAQSLITSGKVTDANKSTKIYGNHQHTSVSDSKNWHINIFLTNGSVITREWKDIRFQVMRYDPAWQDGKRFCYFY